MYYLKQNNHSALHVICGSIDNVAVEDGTFVVSTYDDFIYQHLCEKANQSVISRALIWQDLNFFLKVQKVDKVDKVEQDINKLKALAGEYLIIK